MQPQFSHTQHVRRTVATGLAELGTPATIISKVRDRTLPDESAVTPTYSRYAFLDEKRQAEEPARRKR